MIAAYLQLTGQKSGTIQGAVRDPGAKRNGSIALLSIEHGIASPRDAATGLARGKRQHHPIVITKTTDATTPVFYGMLATNESLKSAELLFYGSQERGGFMAGRETHLYSIKLTKGFVSNIDFSGRIDEQREGDDRLPLIDRISLVYETIEWEWVEGGIAYVDGWSGSN